MKPKKLDGVQVWKEFENVCTLLKLNAIQRAVYSHLLLHTRLEGKQRQRFSITGMAPKLGLSRGPVLEAMRRLADHGVLRFIERNYNGHLVEVRLPAEVPATRSKTGTSGRTKTSGEINIEQANFLNTPALREAIHAREGGRCFYCRRRIPRRTLCLDHVVPRAKSGQDSYRNLVSCCVECNWEKQDRPAPDFLRELYREGRLSKEDLSRGLEALRTLAAGKLRPQVPTGEDGGKGNNEART